MTAGQARAGDTRLSRLTRSLASSRLLYVLLPVLIGLCILGTVLPQGESPEWYAQRLGLWAQPLRLLQLDNVYHGVLFVFLLGLLAVNLAFCSWSRLAALRSRLDILVSHAAIIVVLVGGMIGAIAGMRGNMPLVEGQARDLVENPNGSFRLPFAVLLERFEVEYYDSGRHRLTLTNRREGWSETAFVTPGETAVLHAGAARVAVKDFYPDFVMGERGPESRSQAPNNPALRLEISDGEGAERKWAFAKFGDFHAGKASRYDVRYELEPGRIKQFRSDLGIVENGEIVARRSINVNNPLRWRGYVIYQSGYDPENPSYSNLLVSRDPGAGVVYLGFILLPLGLAWTYARSSRLEP